MSGYLLDTGCLTAYLRGRRGIASLIDPWIQTGEIATSIVVYGEAVEFFKGFPDFPRRKALLRMLMRQIRPYELTYAVMERYADLRRAMRPPHGSGLIGDVNTLIAATALEHRLTVVTLDSDYQRVPGLSVMLLTRAMLM